MFLGHLKLFALLILLLVGLWGCVPLAAIVWRVDAATPEEVSLLDKELQTIGYQRVFLSNDGASYDNLKSTDIRINLTNLKSGPLEITFEEMMQKKFTSRGESQLVVLKEKLTETFGLRLQLLVVSR